MYKERIKLYCSRVSSTMVSLRNSSAGQCSWACHGFGIIVFQYATLFFRDHFTPYCSRAHIFSQYTAPFSIPTQRRPSISSPIPPPRRLHHPPQFSPSKPPPPGQRASTTTAPHPTRPPHLASHHQPPPILPALQSPSPIASCRPQLRTRHHNRRAPRTAHRPARPPAFAAERVSGERRRLIFRLLRLV